MLIIILILLHLCSFLLGHLYLLFHLTAPYKPSLEISQAESTDLIAQHLADSLLLVSDTIKGIFYHKCYSLLLPDRQQRKPKLQITGQSRQSHETEILLSKTAPLLLHCASAGGRARRVPEASVYFNFSPHPESQFTYH